MTMLGKSGRWMLLVLALSAASVAHAKDDDDKQKPWKGKATGEVIADDDGIVAIVFTGEASQLGRFRAEGGHLFDNNPTKFEGVAMFTAANGDAIEVRYSGRLDFERLPFKFEGKLSILGGTGRFSDASGKAEMSGRDFGDGTFEFKFEGKIAR